MSEPATKTVDAWKPAVARIDVRDGNGGQAHGTGVLVTESLVLTALHVVGNRQADPPTFYDDGGEVVLKFPSHETRGRVVRDHVSFSASLDFALVECEHPPRGVRPLPLRDVATAGPDALWNSFGFPLAAAQTGGGMVVEGNISDARGEYQGAEALQLYSQQAAAGDGAPVPGLSGGPVIVDGAVVGVLRSSLMADGGRNVAGTLFACPVRVIAERCGALLPPLEICPGLPGLAARDLPEEPFRYLAWYHENDAELFFGRNRELADVYRRLVDPDEAPLLLLYGQSGVGKSSFLAAGLLPRLKISHDVHYVRRDRDARLLGSILRALGVGEGPEGVGFAAESLAQVWRRLEQDTGRPLVVIADQVEEVYSRPSDREDELDELLAAASALFRDRETRPRGRLVMSFRKEWHAEVVTHVVAAKIARAEVFLRGLDRAGMVEVVRGLVDNPRLRKRYGLFVEEGLAEDIASDLREDRGSPIAPTLQVLLTKMWKVATAANRQSPRFDQALYQQLKRGDLLRDFLREQLAVVDRTHHEWVASGLVLDLLGQHVTDADTAGQRTLAELKAAYAHIEPRVQGLVGELKNSYLLVDSSEDRADHADATRLAHDTLALQVRRMLNESQAPGQRARRILDNRAVEWQGGALGAALDEADLRRVEQGRAGTRVLTADEERLVEASAAERRGRRRRSWVAAGVAGALALVAVGAVMATVRFWRSGQVAEKRTQAEQANTRRVEGEARLRAVAALAETQILDDQLGTLTVVTGIGQSRVELGRVLPALNRSLSLVVQQARQVPFFLLNGGAAVEDLPQDESGRPAAAARFTGGPGLFLALLRKKIVLVPVGDMLRRWELTSGAAPKPLDPLRSGDQAIEGVVASPNGERAASVDRRGKLTVWDVHGNPIGEHQGRGPVSALAFSSDGEHLAIGYREGGVDLLAVRQAAVEIVLAGSQAASRGSGSGSSGYGQPVYENDRAVTGVAVFATQPRGLAVAVTTDRTVTIWDRAGSKWQSRGGWTIDIDSQKWGFRSVATTTVRGEQSLVTGEYDGTVRMWPLGASAHGPLQGYVFYRPAETVGGKAGDAVLAVGDRVTVLEGLDRFHLYHPEGWLIDQQRVRGVGAVAYSSDGSRTVYLSEEGAGLIDGVGLQIARPFRLELDKALGFPSLAFRGPSEGTAGGIAVCNSRKSWVLDLDRRYPDNARGVGNEDDDHRIAAATVKGKEVLVHYGRRSFGVSDYRVQVTGWDGGGGAAAPEIVSRLDPVRPSGSFQTAGKIAMSTEVAGDVEVFDLEQGKSVARTSGAPVSAALLGPRGESRLTVLWRGFVLSRDWAGQEIGVYGCPEPSDCSVRPPTWNYTGLAQSADGQTLAATTAGHIDVWFNATGRGDRPRADLVIERSGVVRAMAASTDGAVFATADDNGIVLYDRAGQAFGQLPAGPSVLTLAFDLSGQFLASIDESRVLRLWRVNPDDWLKIACRRLAMSPRWAEANENAKSACASVRSKAMPSERIGPNPAE